MSCSDITHCFLAMCPMTVEVTPQGVNMSKPNDREYVLNVAQQFLQGLGPHFNPLTSASCFREVCDSTGGDTNCFYRNFSSEAEDFLNKFSGVKLQRLIWGSVDPQTDPLKTGFGSTTIPRTSMGMMWPKADHLFNYTGREILRNVAAVSVVAAAYDLCFCKHHRGGVRPI